MATTFEIEKCGFCFNEPVFGFCEICTVRLGKKCSELHKNASGHVKFQLDTSKKLASGQLIREKDIHQQKCSLHVTENLALYCEKHDATVCGRCIRSNHMICKDSIVDLHEITFDKQRTSERITTLKNLEQEICTIEKHIEENLKSNNECKETYLNAIEKYYKELLTRLDQLVSQSKNAGNIRYAQNEENLKKVQVKCKDTKRHIQEQTNTIQELSEKNQQKHLYIISKRLEKELQNLNSVIRQSSLENAIVKFSFERNSKLQTLLQNTIQEIGTLQEACEGSDEVCDQPGNIQSRCNERRQTDYIYNSCEVNVVEGIDCNCDRPWDCIQQNKRPLPGKQCQQEDVENESLCNDTNYMKDTNYMVAYAKEEGDYRLGAGSMGFTNGYARAGQIENTPKDIPSDRSEITVRQTDYEGDYLLGAGSMGFTYDYTRAGQIENTPKDIPSDKSEIAVRQTNYESDYEFQDVDKYENDADYRMAVEQESDYEFQDVDQYEGKQCQQRSGNK